MGATARWMGYISVDAMDAAADRLRQLGGSVYVPPTSSNIGRISVVADPQNATLALVDGLIAGQHSFPSRTSREGWAGMSCSPPIIRKRLPFTTNYLAGARPVPRTVRRTSIRWSIPAKLRSSACRINARWIRFRSGYSTSISVISMPPSSEWRRPAALFWRVRLNCRAAADRPMQGSARRDVRAAGKTQPGRHRARAGFGSRLVYRVGRGFIARQDGGQQGAQEPNSGFRRLMPNLDLDQAALAVAGFGGAGFGGLSCRFDQEM